MSGMGKLLQELLRDSDALRKKRHTVQQMMTERSRYETVWEQLSKYINPTRGRLHEDRTNEGGRRDWRLLDPYPMEASSKCAAGLHSGLTSPSRPWFALGLQDDELAEYHTVKLWLEECQDIMMGLYAKSNIYNMLMNIEAELTQFGTAAALILEDYNYGVWARPFTCGEYAGEVDARGRVTTFARQFKMTAQQMVREFGEDVVSDAVRTAYHHQDMTTLFEISMLIEPNPNFRPDEQQRLLNFKYRSYYFESKVGDKFLKVSGFHEAPFLMPRWTVVANGVYGVGPGHAALGNCMQLQKLEELNMRLLENRADPPMLVPTSVGKVGTLPGQQTKVPDNLINQVRPLYSITGDRNEVLQAIQYKQSQIGSAFFNDLFVMLSQADNPQMTAREVAERHEEKLLMLSPVLEQMHNEVLAPLTRRSFEICYRNGLLPPVPAELEGHEDTLKVEFVSLLAQAQKSVGTNAMEKTLALAGNLVGIAPDVLDNLNLDSALREHAQMSGTPESIMRDEDEVAKLRKERATQQQQQQELQNAAAMAGPLKDGVEAARLLSQTPVGDSSLNDILGGG